MSNAIGVTELLAAFVGAAAAGGFGIYDRINQRRIKRETLMVSARAHAKFITSIIRQQGYLSDLRGVATAAKRPDWDGATFVIDAAGDYLSALRECVAQAGELRANHAEKIIEFAHRAELFLDSTKPSGHFLDTADLDEKRTHAIEAARNAEMLIKIGDEIAQFK